MLSGYTKIAKSQKYMYALYCTEVGHSCYETKNKIFFTLSFNLEWEMELNVLILLHEESDFGCMYSNRYVEPPRE